MYLLESNDLKDVILFRFKSPKPYFENDGAIIDVSGESEVMCPQMELAANGSGIEIKGQEDCLVLNIYVPNSMYNAVETRAPVMVFIHGGGLVRLLRILSYS